MRKFTPYEDEFLRANYLTIPAKRMSRMLNRAEAVARQRMKFLGIQVPAEVAERFRKESLLKKGNVPVNKGKKMEEWMTPDQIERSKACRFKKGHVPHNTRYDGYERISKDGYIEIRVNGKFKLKHRLVWEQQHGPVPKGMLVVFKDRNPQNIVPENLELITMEENMNRNTIHNYPPEVKSALKLISKLNKKIKHATQ